MSHANANPIGVENLPPRFWAYHRDARELVVMARSPGGWVLHIQRDELFRWQEVRDGISLVARTEYDEFGFETEVRDAEGVVSRTRYDEMHRPLEVTRGTSDVTSYKRNGIGQVTARTGPGDQLETWQYDQYGNLVAHTNALGDTVKMEYDKEGMVTAITNRVGERLEYRRDVQGQIVEEKLFDGRLQRYEYLMGRRVKIELSDGRTITQGFDPAGRLVCREASDGLVEEFAYDKEGRVIKAWNDHAVVELKRDPVGRIVAEIQNGKPVEYRYDADGNRIHRTLPFGVIGAKMIRGFDVRGRLLAFWDDRGPVQEFRWDNIDRLIQRRCPGGITELLTYDSERRLHQQRIETMGGRIVRIQTYDSSGNIASLQEQLSTAHYTYDPLNRLRVVRRNGVMVEAYDYDANDALRATHRGPRRLVAGGKTVQEGKRELSYGDDGAVNAIRAGGSAQALKHDVNGQLVEVVQPDGTVIRYEYDPFGRRTAKIIGKDRTEFLWEVWELAAELRDGEAPIIYVSAGLRPLAQWKGRSRLTPILDHRGAVQEVLDELGQLRWSCALDAYGNLLSETGDTPNPFRLRGQYQDAETGFHYNYHRHYDPDLGDYTAPDPIGVEGGYHFYAYPRNPLRWDDPFGLECDGKPKEEGDPPCPTKPNIPGTPAKPGLEDPPEGGPPNGTPQARVPDPEDDRRYADYLARKAAEGDPPMEGGRAAWQVAVDRLRDNNARGNADEAAALAAAGVPNNNRGNPPVTYPAGVDENGNPIRTRPDGVTDDTVVDVKSVKPGTPDDPAVVNNTNQLRSQQDGANKDTPPKNHVTIITSKNDDGTPNPDGVRPSGPLADSKSTVLFHDPTPAPGAPNGTFRPWDSSLNNGKGGWGPPIPP